MTEDMRQQQDTRPLPEAGREKLAKHGGTFLGHLLGRVITKVAIAIVIVLVAAYLVLAKLESLNPFTSHTTITTTVVLGKLTKIEQVHVATRSYPVDVQITQSVGVIPCFLICNQMELKGSGTDDAVADLSKLSRQDVSIDQSTETVTVRMAAPAVSPAVLNAAACTITSTHGAVNGLTAAFRSNPNGYRPLYAAAQSQIHVTAQHDKELLTAGEQSTRALLTRILGTVGVKKVTVNFT
ncbi:MAG TPA: DUF4230 domain-containing protein [Trebonia sp.]